MKKAIKCKLSEVKDYFLYQNDIYEIQLREATLPGSRVKYTVCESDKGYVIILRPSTMVTPVLFDNELLSSHARVREYSSYWGIFYSYYEPKYELNFVKNAQIIVENGQKFPIICSTELKPDSLCKILPKSEPQRVDSLSETMFVIPVKQKGK